MCEHPIFNSIVFWKSWEENLLAIVPIDQQPVHYGVPREGQLPDIITP